METNMQKKHSLMFAIILICWAAALVAVGRRHARNHLELLCCQIGSHGPLRQICFHFVFAIIAKHAENVAPPNNRKRS